LADRTGSDTRAFCDFGFAAVSARFAFALRPVSELALVLGRASCFSCRTAGLAVVCAEAPSGQRLTSQSEQFCADASAASIAAKAVTPASVHSLAALVMTTS
jgi:hypothetical protein